MNTLVDFISEAVTDFQLLDSSELGRAQKVVLGLYLGHQRCGFNAGVIL